MAKWTLEEVNQRLKAGRIGVSVCQRGDRLSLRGTFPAKPGINKPPYQQYLALGCYASPAGLQYAEAEAKKIGGLLAQKQFSWNDYLEQPSTPIADVQSWVNKFEIDYYTRKGHTPTTETTWKSDYLPAWQLLEGELTPATIIAAVRKTTANTRKRKRVCEKLLALAKFADITVDLKPYIGTYGSSETTPRNIPNKTEIEESRNLFTSHWRWGYGVLAAYGLRPHELFFCEISPDYPYLLKVLKGKTGYREVYPYHLEWAKEWQLWEQATLPCNADTFKEYGSRVTKVFARKKPPFTPYCLRHAYCIRLATEYKIPVAIAANWAGHEPGTYLKIYQKWIGEAEKRRVFEESQSR